MCVRGAERRREVYGWRRVGRRERRRVRRSEDEEVEEKRG